MFNDSKYTIWYFGIINKANNLSRKKSKKEYFESHHIIPKSLGGSNDKENLVLLTAKEHFICHWLLTKMVTEKEHIRKMQAAIAYFLQNTKRCLNSTYIDIARKNASEYRRNQIPWNKGISHSQQTKEKISKARKGSSLKFSENDIERRRKVFKTQNSNKEFIENNKIRKSKTYEITFPNGDTKIITNMNSFCRENNLSSGNMSSVAKGHLKQHKGFKCVML